MTIARKITRAFAALFLGAVMLWTGSGVAAADTACPDDNVCLYEHRDFGGKMLAIPAGTSYSSLHKLTCQGCESSKHSGSDGTWGDMMSSWRNTSDTYYCWYWDVNFGSGSGQKMPQNSEVSYVGSDPNDQASSVAPC